MNARARRLAPFAGYLMVALIFVGLAVVSDSPDSKASGAKVIAFVQHHKTAIHVQTFLLAYAALAAVVYFASIAQFLRTRGSQVLATTTVAGAALFASGLCVAVGINESLADQPGRLSESAAQTMNVLGQDVFAILMFAGLALAMGSAGVAMLRTKSLPIALGVITTIAGVAAGTGIVAWFGFLGTGVLTLVIAPYVYSRTGTPAEITLPDATVAVPAQTRRTKSATKSDTAAKTSA